MKNSVGLIRDENANAATEWALALFRRSVLKQEKYRQIERLIGPVEGKVCLDIGADNGVISLLLRQRGGEWHSADLDEASVAAIRGLVRDNVYTLDGGLTPFPDRMFDLVVIVDYLEHIEEDRAFVAELRRILRPGGVLIVNVPHLQPRLLLNRLRPLLGLTDERHGHVRPGYTLEGLQELLGDRFTVAASHTYSKLFAEAIDIFLNSGLELLRRFKGRRVRSAKGQLFTQSDWQRHRKELRLLSILHPLLWLCVRLDRLLPGQGYKLIVKATLREEGASPQGSVQR